MHDLMNTHEVAEYLRIKQRKVYDLVQTGRIPCTRVTGKWLFPRAVIDLWVLDNTAGVRRADTREAPPVIAGSHDPLLEWAARESRSELAILFDGSLDGVARVMNRQARVCGLHVVDPEGGDYNRHLFEGAGGGADIVLVRWAWREQGLMTASGNPLNLRSLTDVKTRRARLIDRQPGAGSHLLLEYLLGEIGACAGDLERMAEPARNERDAALAVADGAADVALGIAAEARQHHLDFIPLHRERYDLLCRRRDYFEPPLQAILKHARAPAFAAKAAELGGYDITDLGDVVYNAP